MFNLQPKSKQSAKCQKRPAIESLFLIKLQASASNLIKKETLEQLLSSEFYENFKNSFFIEHIWWLLLKGK